MAMISVEEAAARIGVSPQIIEAWAEQGLLTIHRSLGPSKFPPNTFGSLILQRLVEMERLVEEDELYRVAESLGWLYLSAEHWDGSEE